MYRDTVLNLVPEEADTKDLINDLNWNGLTTSMMLASEPLYRDVSNEASAPSARTAKPIIPVC
jgi:hypothetical protein